MTNSEESSLYEKSLFRSTCTTHGWGGGRSAGDRQLIHTVQLFKKKWLFILQASHTCWVHVYMYDVLEMANGACNLDGHETVMLLLWFTTLTLLYYITTALSPGKCLNMCEAEKGLLLKCTEGPVNRLSEQSESCLLKLSRRIFPKVLLQAAFTLRVAWGRCSHITVFTVYRLSRYTQHSLLEMHQTQLNTYFTLNTLHN